MELDYALLADAAAISEGKTFILGGGVSILWRPEYPAPLGVSLVAQFTFHRTEVGTEHQMSIRVMDADGNPVLPEIQGQMNLGEPRGLTPSNVPLVAPIVLPFPPAPVLQRPGAYSVEILLDGRRLKSLPFAVAHPPTPTASE
ncbi:MAG TPA: hypothetical protein VGJ40_01110 [Gaiellaceae bacterium]|jgi:Family of unknown function (DUF6941)